MTKPNKREKKEEREGGRERKRERKRDWNEWNVRVKKERMRIRIWQRLSQSHFEDWAKSETKLKLNG